MTEQSGHFTVVNGEAVTVTGTTGYKYLSLMQEATESRFQSQIRQVVIEHQIKQWVVDKDSQMIISIPEGISAETLSKYYTDLEYFTALRDADGNKTDKVGTGYKMYLDDEVYVLVVDGDVNGDAEVDVFDLYDMLGHFNSDATLEGAYLKAGCVTQEEDITIFDIYSALNYVNTGEFTQ